MKLALGTVQFGMNYGITNRDGQPTINEIEKILSQSLLSGVDTLDTANAYGVSEEVLGQILENDTSFKIITKTPPLRTKSINDGEIEYINSCIEQSFLRLKHSFLYGVLIHHGEELLLPGGERLFAVLENLKKNNRVRKIGISVSSPEVLEKVLELFPVDLIQAPLNLFDQRLIKSGMIEKLGSRGIEIHTRSAFLQGVLLSEMNTLPKHFDNVRDQLVLLQNYSDKMGVSKMALAFGFLKRSIEIDKILVGVLNEQQLVECVDAYHAPIIDELDFDRLECRELSIIDPSRWSYT